MGIGKYFGIKEVTETQTEIQNVKGTCFDNLFCEVYLENMYSKVMYECADRASLPTGVDKEAYTLTMYDSYSPAKKGLVSLVVHAMKDQEHVFYRKEKLPRGDYIFEKVDPKDAFSNSDMTKIKPDILELDFRTFNEGKILCLLFALVRAVVQTLSNGTTISQALILKIHKLSEMIENTQNMEPFVKQIQQLNDSITDGRAGYVDAGSAIEMLQYDPKPATEAAEYVFQLISSLTGIPSSYLFSDVIGGLGDMSNSEERRLNVALKRYFNSILSGVLYSVFDKLFLYKNIISDIPATVELFTWLETTSMITNEGKAKILLDNTALEEQYIEVKDPTPIVAPTIEPDVTNDDATSVVE